MAATHSPQDPISSNASDDNSSTSPHPTSNSNEKAIFSQILYPDDSFTPEGTYWADLPWKQRIKFVNAVDKAEAKKEWNSMRAMMKESFFSPIGWYFKNAVLPGAGLGLEG